MRRLTLDVERLTYGPDALARHDGRIVFVGGAAPGDRVTADVVEEKPGFLRARVASLLRDGPARVTPACPWAGRCGGCTWQHVDVAAQREAKRAVVAEQLERLGGLRDVEVLPVLAAPEPWHTRARITLGVEGRRLGYRAARSHALVEVDDCLVADPALVATLPVARAWIERLRTVPERVTLAVAPGGIALHAHARRPPGAADVAATEALLREAAVVRGAVLTGGDARLVVGDPRLRVVLADDLVLEVPADAFTQVHPAANRLLVREVLAFGAFAPGDRVLDLYCGAGNFALPLARTGAAVCGIERSAVAVAAARENARRLRLDADFVAGDVAATLAALPSGHVHGAVLDPPRAGAADALAALVARRPSRILYVSCDPATLARDARTLAMHGWRCVRARPVDLFPHTFHVETVAEFVC